MEMKFPVPGHPAISSIIQPARQEKGRNLTTAKLPNELISYGHQLTGTEICLIFGKDVRWILEVNFCPGLRSRIQHVHVILAKGAWPKQYFFKATALPLNRKCPPGNFVYYTVQLNRLHPLSQNRLQLINSPAISSCTLSITGVYLIATAKYGKTAWWRPRNPHCRAYTHRQVWMGCHPPLPCRTPRELQCFSKGCCRCSGQRFEHF